MTAQAAPANDRELGGARMPPKRDDNKIQTVRPRLDPGQVTGGARALGKGSQAVPAAAPGDMFGLLPAGSPQEDLQEIQELMKLKDSNPAEFEAYLEMAADAAKLAEERPDVFRQLMQENGGGAFEGLEEKELTTGEAERKRAIDAASELIGAKKGDLGTDGNMEIDLPGGRTLGAGGAKDKSPSVVIAPKPGFVIKTKLIETEMKVFINVCQHERIGESSIMKKLDKDGQEVEGLNIPMSVGPPTVDKDNAGKECIVYDVIINPKTVEECRVDKTGGQRDFLCHLAMQSVMSKHDCRLDPKYKLPKLTFKGNKEEGPLKQRIRDDSAKPQISEIKANSGKKGDAGAKPEVRPAAKGHPGQATPALPLTSLTSTTTAVWVRDRGLREVAGENLRETDVSAMSLRETVRIPVEQWPDSLIVTASGLRKEAFTVEREFYSNVGVEASAYECIIKASGHHHLQVRLPYAVLPDTASAQANSHDSVLFVNLSVDKSPPSLQADAGSKPWLLSSALEGAGERRAGQSEGGGGSDADVEKAGANGAQDSNDVLPEDRFHLKLPAGVNQYTGAAEEGDTGRDHDLDNEQIDQERPVSEQDSLPEDRFHRADIVSQHMIDTREKQRKEKIERAEKEREARKQEPPDKGVEYVDFDDYRPGGKLGPPAPPSPKAAAGIPVANPAAVPPKHDPKFSQDMAAATRVLSATNSAEHGRNKDGAVESQLSSEFWAELLD